MKKMDTIKTEVSIDSDIYELVPFFRESRKKELETIYKYLAAGDFTSIAKISHTIKGIARPYGYPTLETLFIKLEQAAKSSDSAACSAILTQVKEYFDVYFT
ncbi:MAG: Hpt domain-containing protein [Pseudobdellovibrio sp.]